MTVRSKWLLPCALCLLATACAPDEPTGASATEDATSEPGPAVLQAPVPSADAGLAAYLARASALQARLTPGADVAAVRGEAEVLLQLGAALVPDFVARHPQCKDYLDAALTVRSAWPAMDVATIERDFHHDGVLPKLDDPGVCYHMKDLVVHPATVLVLLSSPTPDFGKAQAEIAEVVQHAGVVGRD